MVYGKNPKHLVSEKDNLFVDGALDTGLWWYAVSKLADEAYANSIMLEDQQARIMIIRPFNVIAPIQTDQTGFVFPRFFKAASNNEPVLIYGDGKQSRTFTWAPDFVDCLILLVENEIWRTTVNIGGTEPTTIIDLAHKIREAMNSSSEIEFIDPQTIFNNQFVEINHRTPDVSLLKSLIKKTPNTSLDFMINRFSTHFKNRDFADKDL